MAIQKAFAPGGTQKRTSSRKGAASTQDLRQVACSMAIQRAVAPGGTQSGIQWLFNSYSQGCRAGWHPKRYSMAIQ